MERYLDRCRALLVRLDGLLPSVPLDRAHELIDHGEPSIGMRRWPGRSLTPAPR